MIGRSLLVVLFAVGLLSSSVYGQVPPKAIQIAGAISPAPEDLKEGARVLGYNTEGAVIELRAGSNDLTCLADMPGDDRFHAACYQNSLEPFMARGRTLRKEGKGRNEIREIRLAEIESGSLSIPEEPTALYQLFGDASSQNPESGIVTSVRPLYVMYIPYATTESTGLSSQAPMPGAPWLMDAGLPWAHIMYSPPQPDTDN